MKYSWRIAGALTAVLLSITLVGAVGPYSGSDATSQVTGAGMELQQPKQPVMSIVDRVQLAFPGFQSGGESTGTFPGRLMSQNFNEWPPMLYVGETAEIAGKTFTVKEVLLVSGSDRAMAYEPATGRKRFAPEGLRTNLLDFNKNTEVFIPPNSTLVMVNIEVEPEAIERPPGQAGCETPGERDYADVLRMSHNNSGERNVILTDRDENFGSYRSPRIYCLNSGWLYFHVGSLEVNEEQLWFELVDADFEGNLAIWKLVSIP